MALSGVLVQLGVTVLDSEINLIGTFLGHGKELLSVLLDHGLDPLLALLLHGSKLAVAFVPACFDLSFLLILGSCYLDVTLLGQLRDLV